MKNCLFKVCHAINYIITRKNPIKIHSPFLYNMYLNAYKTNYDIPNELLDYENKLKHSNEPLRFQSLGANKRFIETTISYWHRKISCSLNKRLFIIGLAQYFKTNKILELGGGFGFTSALLAMSNTDLEVYTIEGVDDLCKQLLKLKNRLKIDNLHVYNLEFDEAIDEFISKNIKFEIIIIDGSHTYEATLNLINKITKIIAPLSIVILDDINYSYSMYSAWKNIKKIDFFEVKIERYNYGLLIKNSNLSQQFLKI
ncbi:MAG: class I SAM-dependent methyltransferase [Bacteroidales bacterium]|jgi:predicted O-methyltransferase YrrM|nr:class I SAM-dependent methyltransferase [Bacteroidales bacterium]MDI9575658.1 class I SAM-dependent methyltransferase [Bacteroidota bacterium]MDD2594054.1 class I SAM-dependent methyltransferase [Bacteroidales bacterium]MDD3755915.1 class I SAM-dependent methyltransferase [Bacteroidales bacterium]MDY0400841.1 class I SAM-dependent methyltransferase [Bacteroidales bacterium]